MLNIVTTPQILTDDIFTTYGGATGSSTAAQRQAAYCIAEGEAVTEIGTFVTPTIVTGTYTWPPFGNPLQIQHTHLSNVLGVVGIHEAGCNCAADAYELSGCAWIIDADGGLVSLRECGSTAQANCSGCNCAQIGSAYQVRIVYTAGLPAGASSDPRLLLGLVTVADLALQQITDQCAAEGGPGDPGVQSYGSIGYTESRFPLQMTAFGASARANYAAGILREFKFNRALKLGR